MNFNVIKTIHVLDKGGIVVAPTDTIYGVLGSALNKQTVERIYRVRARDTGKPCIVLVSHFAQIEQLGVNISKNEKNILENFWPGKISVVLECNNKKFYYLHRGTKTIAFRMIGPRHKNLYYVLNKTGPLVAPSANPQGFPPAKSINEAKKYFGEKIDVYVNGGIRNSKPSTLISILDGKTKILRK